MAVYAKKETQKRTARVVDGTPTPTKTGVPGFAINFDTNTRVDPQNYFLATMKRERRGMWVGLNE